MRLTSSQQLQIEQKAYQLGFSLFGVSKAEFLDEEARFLEKWLQDQSHGEMAWMENHFDKRTNPTKLVEGAQTVVSLGFEYLPALPAPQDDTYKISKYAYGKDYHKVLKKKLIELLHFIEEKVGAVNGRAFVDSAPVMEKAWAKRSGLGWIGKNTLVLNRKKGSQFFLAELILDVEMETTSPVKDLCRTCNLCVEACPTDALNTPYQLDAKKCISYLTIELRNEIPTEFKGQMENWIFGCDICQDVCPWTRNTNPTLEPAFNRHVGWKDFSKKDWEEITDEVFLKVFAGTPVMRTKNKGLKRNIKFISSHD
ncbi:tRNA epoxyqueuosine(34) reductase QueG [bacterium SCSIO 12643]|nr:tRNA epoxyqueuosine(34) reductase QueG [bacterium SCSIO 12643]